MTNLERFTSKESMRFCRIPTRRKAVRRSEGDYHVLQISELMMRKSARARYGSFRPMRLKSFL